MGLKYLLMKSPSQALSRVSHGTYEAGSGSLGFHFPILLDATFDPFQSVAASKTLPMVSKVSPEPRMCHLRLLGLSSGNWEIGNRTV